MASGYTRAKARQIIDDQFGTTARTAPTTPMKLAVMTTLGTTTAAGTELASTTRPSVTFSAATDADPPVASNSAQVTVVAGAAGTLVANEIYDSAATPVRTGFGPLSANRTVQSGDSLVYAVGALSFNLASP